MVATYERMAASIATANEGAQAFMVRLAQGGDARTALAVFCAQQGYTAEAAATAIGCDGADLDAVIARFAASVRSDIAHERARRAA